MAKKAKKMSVPCRVTNIIEPEPRPSVPVIIEQLTTAYHELIERTDAGEVERKRLLAVADDMGWYADRIGSDRWSETPRQNKWSFDQQLWRLTKEARDGLSDTTTPIHYYIDQGKMCVGLVAEIVSLWESEDS